ncbi:HPt domain protein [Desulforapulum autotrophicum HRM2]|uniref:HPt domain protein n=1 Tax=Desulforapulum autotrophicum (strain ATCC 43914 / DSM 3382 / VKM B-1955 / HRM2) TaxID=177437 RepID=C0QFH7_DESAH|nr:Hpt domain-containing protein [Desulforapulum autotrophicum]ACN13373.1 HPt domain protein [Desulforapulum autotrophicum HRM2]
MDFKAMASKLGFSEADFIELAQLLVTTSRSELLTVEQGIANESSATVAKAAHSIKGAAANLGFTHIAAMAKELESLAVQKKFHKIRSTAADLGANLDAIQKVAEGC